MHIHMNIYILIKTYFMPSVCVYTHTTHTDTQRYLLIHIFLTHMIFVYEIIPIHFCVVLWNFLRNNYKLKEEDLPSGRDWLYTEEKQ